MHGYGEPLADVLLGSELMIKGQLSRMIRRLTIPILVGALSLTAASAQIGGYPVDPDDQRTSSTSAADRTAADAADLQSSVPPSNTYSYEPDEIETSSTKTSESDDREDRAVRDRRDREEVTRVVRRPAKPSEYEQFVSQIVDKPLRRFGANLLVPESRDFTAPPTTAVPPDYRLNPGDELLIGLTGSVQASNLRVTVSPEGQIFVPRVGAIDVAGSRYGDVQALIARQVSRQYRNFRVAVSIGRLHGITVYVTGFAAQPGSYTVSSLSTLVNAVLAAGGPSEGGSFRSIQVRRNGQLISDFDLYDLLLKGDKSADVLLQNGDVIYITPAGTQVAVIGSVNVEAIYEAKASETLYDMLLYAGGVNTVADNRRLLVFDPTKPGGWQELTPQQVQNRIASRGEIVRVLSAVGIAQPQFRQPAVVTVSGEVNNPGRYYVQPGTSLNAVIAQAGGLTPQAYPYASVYTRESVKVTQRRSYERAMRDVELLLTTQPLTSATQNNQLEPTRLQAIESVVEQLKAREPDGRLVLGLQPIDTSLPNDMLVENNDTIYVPPQPVTVGVFGAVPSPASFQYRRGMTIREYVRQAGGVQKIGDRGAVFVVRANGTLATGNVMRQQALPGDLIFVPVNATRGEFWARLRDITSSLLPSVVTAAAVAK
jgi:polysaccharide export outer membrane protein